MKVIIDRFEGDFAVCEKEDRTMMDIEKSKIPTTAKEGDVLNITNDRITIDVEETKKRKKEIEELTKDLWN
jgi:tetrahydromethanopterin S-methyltransferase subunit B